MLRKIVEEIVKTLVDDPSFVEIIDTQEPDGTQKIVIKIAEADLGKVIGRNGQTIKAIRAVVHAVNAENKEVLVDIAQ
jgi:uncharacterized protein